MKIEKPNEFDNTVKVGEYTFDLPEPPKNYKEIQGWNLKPEEQKWERPKDILGEKGFEALDTDGQEKYLTREFKRRRNGFWFYNCGRINYITGDHYFFLVYWRLDDGLPYFKESDQKFFWLFNYSWSLSWCLGLMQLTNRRDGKTARSTAVMYNRITLKEDALAGIQSKTNGDSKRIFNKVISSWKKLENYMKPKDSGDTNPQKQLRFEEPSKRSTKDDNKVYKAVLNSSINYGSSSEVHYDGDRLYFYYDDEIGKTVESNVYDRWLVVRECLKKGRTVVGKSLHTSTVEEMEKQGGENCYRMWMESDLQQALNIGRDSTQLGLLRYFKPATEGLEGFIDEYGRSVVEDPEEPVMGIDGELITQGSLSWIKSERVGLSSQALASHKRKYPLDIDEAFYIDGKDCIFDAIKLNEQIEHNNSMAGGFIVKGNFVYTDESKRNVEFKQSENGRFDVIWMPNQDDRNKTTIYKGALKPSNFLSLSAGVDPFDHRYTTDNRKSNAAFYIFRKTDIMDIENSNMFVCQYVNRPVNPEDFYDDILKCCIFYGCELLAENNKIGLINHFRIKGFYHYLMDRPDVTHVKFSKKRQLEKGVPMNSSELRQSLIEKFEIYILDNVGYNLDEMKYGKMYFNKLCKCLISFKPDKWTDYDEFVGAVLALAGAERYKKPVKSSYGLNNDSVSNYVRIYKN